MGSPIAFLLEGFARGRDAEALVCAGRSVTYGELLEAVERTRARLDAAGLPRGAVVALEADFSPEAVAALLALIERGAVVVPLTDSVAARHETFRRIAQVEWRLAAGGAPTATGLRAEHPFYTRLRREDHPGLVLFSSGSSGEPKAAVHDWLPLLEKFHAPRPALRTLAFLLFDHIGGLNTLLYGLANGACLVVVEDRGPETVCRAIERHRVELLPTSPTFLNLLLAGGAWRRHDLSSLRRITYGTEPMAQSTLERLHAVFPGVELQQTYGLSELGILRSKSRGPDSLWVKIGGEGFETRVVDGLLEIRARSAMLGYLNAPSPFTDDGWFRTGDAVEVDGEWMRILGRRSELINVGGEKVYPAEVESVLRTLDGVLEVAVSGEAHPLTGQIVKAVVRLAADEEPAAFRRRMRVHCRGRLAPYQIPQKVVFSDRPLHGERFKTLRREAGI